MRPDFFNMAVEGNIKIYISAVPYNIIYYILRQSLTHNATIKLLEELADMIEIMDVTNRIIRQSLKTDFRDFENAIQYLFCIEHPKC
jgi:hypothetical protein